MRALLLDAGDGAAALGAARALHAAGWTVGLGTPVRALLHRSRAVAAQHRVPWPASGTSRAMAAIDAAVEGSGYDVVLPCGDDWVALLDDPDAPRAWSPYRRGGAARRCLDKLEVARAATAVGLRTPRTVPADDAALARWQGPAVVKARSHWLPDHADPSRRLEAVRVRRAADARSFVDSAVAAGGAAVLQEPVDGRLVAVVGLVRHGRFVQVAQQRADLVWPQPMGITARARTVPPDPTLVRRAGALAGELGYEGLLQVQVLEPTDGSPPLVIDCNPRCYGSISLAGAAGLDMVAAWASWAATGREPRQAQARAGVGYVWTEGALRATLAARRVRPDDAPPASSRLLRLLRLLPDLVTSTHPRWTLRDPLPAVLTWLGLAGRLVRRLVGGTREQ